VYVFIGSVWEVTYERYTGHGIMDSIFHEYEHASFAFVLYISGEEAGILMTKV
jgi:hypothetical protein